VVSIKAIRRFLRDTRGDSVVVEATILFPIIIMIFAALVMLAMYLPQRVILQEAAQVAAVTIANERSDTWIAFDGNADFIGRGNQPAQRNVYVRAFQNAFPNAGVDEVRAQSIVNNFTATSILSAPGRVHTELNYRNYLVYQEVIVTVTQTIPMPVNLMFIGFPREVTITQQAVAVILDGDEFVRSIDIATDVIKWIDNKLGVSESLDGALKMINDPRIRGLFGH
jgi:Flp pilus assembly protein TadG